MKKIVLFCLVLLFWCNSAIAATNGVGKWILKSNKISVYQITYATITDAETFTINEFNGSVLRIVVVSATNDADGTLSMKDISDVNYVSLPATTFSAVATVPISYIIKSIDQDSNAYGGQIVAGKHTGTLTNCADLGVTVITIYFE